MNTSMLLFHTPEIVVAEITEDLLCAVIIRLKDTKATGKTVQIADNPSKQKCTFGTGLMNTILRSLRTRLLTNLQNALDVESSLI